MLKIDLVVFDMIGTTVRATDQVPTAFRKAFAQLGMTLSDEEIQSVRGKSKREAISYILTAQNATDERRLAVEVYNAFHRILKKYYSEQGVEPINGAAEIFSWLKTRNIKVALSTGFDRELANLLIQKIGWENSIDTVVCNEDVPRGRPAPYLLFRAMERTNSESVHRVAAVGDTVSDLQAAFNASVGLNVGVLTGAHSETYLKSNPHSAIIPSVKELTPLLQ